MNIQKNTKQILTFNTDKINTTTMYPSKYLKQYIFEYDTHQGFILETCYDNNYYFILIGSGDERHSKAIKRLIESSLQIQITPDNEQATVHYLVTNNRDAFYNRVLKIEKEDYLEFKLKYL